MRNAVLCFAFGSALTLCAQQLDRAHQIPYRFQDTHLPADERIADLLAHMTIEEKIAVLSTNPSVPRLGVAGTGHVEGLHGLALGGPGGWEGKNLPIIPTTQFPQARGLGQTWDPVLIEQAAAVEARETRYAYNKYHRGGLVVRAPNADLSRDPRWGRSEESYGEDPFLVGTMATAFTKGLQGADKSYWSTASLLKHFLANSNEDGRDGSSSDFDGRLFQEYYAAPFRMAIEDGKANAFMTSYNAWNKVPMTENPILRDVVMKEWGFDGIICTDAGALTNMVKAHHIFQTLPQAAAAAIHAGINQFLDDYKQPVRDALAQKLITNEEIDRNLRGVFRVMLRLGMLDPSEAVPYASIGFDDLAKGDPWEWQKHQALARRVTDESIVLLKNEGNLLPIDSSKMTRIAVIGPLANRVALDWYSGTPPYAVTPLDGIRTRAGTATSVTFSNGDDLAEATALAAKADVAVVIIGNHPTCDAGWTKCALASDGKEAIDRKSLTLEQESLAKAVFSANPRTVVVLQTSFPYTTNWTAEHIPAILQITHNSEEQGNGLADVLFGDYNPAGRLTQTWVSSMDQLPPMMDYDIRHGRTYLYLHQKPLYAFGFGLSYTTFAYNKLRISSSKMDGKGEETVSVDVKNSGKRDGDEVVQMYVAYPNSSVIRPIEELKNFQRISLHAGEGRTVSLRLTAKAIAYWKEETAGFVVEPGAVEVRVGSSSDNIKLHQVINIAP
jgi:beta-glucosidase